MVPDKGERNKKGPPHPCLLGGPKEGGNATPPLHSRRSPINRNNMRSGCLTRAFSGAQKRAEMLRHPCILRDPQRQARRAKSQMVPKKGERNKKWLPHPCLLGGPKEGGNGMSPLHSRGSPTPSTESKITSGSRRRGTKSEVAASPLPFGGLKRGRKCYGTPAFLGITNKEEQNQKWLPQPCLSGAQRRAEMLRHPCLFRDPQRQARRAKSQVVPNKAE